MCYLAEQGLVRMDELTFQMVDKLFHADLGCTTDTKDLSLQHTRAMLQYLLEYHSRISVFIVHLREIGYGTTQTKYARQCLTELYLFQQDCTAGLTKEATRSTYQYEIPINFEIRDIGYPFESSNEKS